TASPSRSTGASSPSSGPTAAARPRSSASSPASSPPTRATSSSTAGASTARASATSPRPPTRLPTSPSTRSSRSTPPSVAPPPAPPPAALARPGIAGPRSGSLSLGQRRRACLGPALVGSPWLLVLDEPTNGLDLAGVELLARLLRDHAGRGAVLVATHDLAF